MDEVVLKFGKKKLTITKKNLSEQFENTFKVSVCGWLSIPEEEWSRCVVTVASEGNADDEFCTKVAALYDDVKSWLHGCLPVNNVESPMVVSVMSARAPKRVGKRTCSAAASGATTATGTEDRVWEKAKGGMLHISAKMQLAVGEAGKQWYDDLEDLIAFTEIPENSFIQPCHSIALNKYAARVRHSLVHMSMLLPCCATVCCVHFDCHRGGDHFGMVCRCISPAVVSMRHDLT